MKTMKKYYRVFLLGYNELNVQSPIITEWLDIRWNWYDTIEDAEERLSEIIKKQEYINHQFTILPVYETDKIKY